MGGKSTVDTQVWRHVSGQGLFRSLAFAGTVRRQFAALTRKNDVDIMSLSGNFQYIFSPREELNMSLRLNDTAPDFTAETTQGTIKFHEWIGDGWAILFSHPKDFTPVCTTELGYMAGLEPEFKKRNCKILGLSVDPVTNHSKWAADIEETQGHKVNYPMIGDPELKVAKLYDMLPAEAGETCEGRTAVNNQTVRTVFVIGPDKKIKLQLTYPMSTGRNFDEVLRVLDSMQLTAKHKVATPVNWKQGSDVIILPSVSDDEAKQKYPDGWKTVRPYLRVVPQPK
jgi:thioredoxin-dependent peroxiredoxin